MYSQQDGPTRRHSRLLIDLEDQIRPPWLLKELQGELEMEKEAFGVVDPHFECLTHGWGDGSAPV